MYCLAPAADKTDQMGLSYSTDLIHWTEATKTPLLPRRPRIFDSRGLKPGPPPNITMHDLDITDHAAAEHLIYRTTGALLHLHDTRQPPYLPHPSTATSA